MFQNHTFIQLKMSIKPLIYTKDCVSHRSFNSEQNETVTTSLGAQPLHQRPCKTSPGCSFPGCRALAVHMVSENTLCVYMDASPAGQAALQEVGLSQFISSPPVHTSESDTQWALNKCLLNKSFVIHEALVQSNLLNDFANKYERKESNYTQENYTFLRYLVFFPVLLGFISSASSYLKMSMKLMSSIFKEMHSINIGKIMPDQPFQV